MSQIKLYDQLQIRNQNIPLNNQLAQQLKGFLQNNGLLIPKQKQSVGTVDIPLLYSQLISLNFQGDDIIKAFNTYFQEGWQSAQKIDKNEKQKMHYIAKINNIQNDLIQLLLINLNAQNIPSELGGGRESTDIYTSLNQNTESSQNNQIYIKPNERKPRRWRQQSFQNEEDTPEQKAILMQKCCQILKDTLIISECLVKQIAEACNFNEELCYLTAITSMMRFQRGFPKMPKELLTEQKLENFIQKSRNTEFQLISVSGYQIKNSENPLLQKYDSWSVQCQTVFKPFINFELRFSLQPKESCTLLQENTKFHGYDEQPLIVEQNAWKTNFQFRGPYPLVLPLVDLFSEELSPYGKVIILKQVYNFLQNEKYNKQPILSTLLKLQEKGLENDFLRYEEQLQKQQLSTINTKEFKKEQIIDSFFMSAQKRVKDSQNKNTDFLSLSPLLYKADKSAKALLTVQSCFQNKPSGKFIYIEDFSTILNQKMSSTYKFQQKLLQNINIEIQDAKQSEQQQIQNKIKQFDFSKFKEIYNQKNWQKALLYNKQRQQLPIFQNQSELLKIINNNDIIILQAETGSGKSTNLPQLILEDAFAKNKAAKVIITQPRKIAAVSLARRVADESGFEVGNQVGYAIKGQSSYSDNTLILFCTVGHFVRRIVGSANELLQYTHLVIDEVHERDLHTDTLLGMLHNHYFYNKQALPKIIIMSATIDGEKFLKYFEFLKLRVYNVAGKQYKTDTYFLDSYYKELQIKLPLLKKTNKNDNDCLNDYIDENETIDDDNYYCGNQSLDSVDDSFVNKELIYQILANKIYFDPQITGNTLIFLPGVFEITSLQKHLQCKLQNSKISLKIVICHGQLNMIDQQQLFQLKNNESHIIIATNIAEASVTLPNIVAVIDSGLERRVQYIPQQKKHLFKTCFISKQSATQRAGRAGRVCDGAVYRTYTQNSYDLQFDQYRTPEIMTANLSSAIMQLLLLAQQNYDPKSLLYVETQPHIFLQNLIDPPKKGKIALHVKELIDNKLLTSKVNSFCSYYPNIKQINENQTNLEEIYTLFTTQLTMTMIGNEVAFLPIEPVYYRVLYFCELLQQNKIITKMLISVLTVGTNQIIKGSVNQFFKFQKSDIIVILLIFKQYLIANRNSFKNSYDQNMKNINVSGLESAKDTLLELLTDEEEKQYIHILQKISDIELNSVQFLLQLTLPQNTVFKLYNPQLRYSKYYILKNKNTEVKIHNSSVLMDIKPNLFQFTEMLQINNVNYCIGCNNCFIFILLYNYDFKCNYRQRTIELEGLEFNASGVEIALLETFYNFLKKSDTAYYMFKQLVEFETEQFK